MKISDSINPNDNKRTRSNHFLTNSLSHLPLKKPKPNTILNTAYLHIKPLEIPLISSSPINSSSQSILLKPYIPYTIGRNPLRCEFIFDDPRVSNQHLQLYFDAKNRKIYVCDGGFLFNSCSKVRVSLNGVFVNGVKIGNGEIVELCAGDDVSLVCGNGGVCCFGIRIGFVVKRIVFVEEVVDRKFSMVGTHGGACDYDIDRSVCGGIIEKVNYLITQCREILHSDEPINYIRKFAPLNPETGVKCISRNRVNSNFSLTHKNIVEFPTSSALHIKCGELLPMENKSLNSIVSHRENVVVSKAKMVTGCCNVNVEHVQQMDNAGVGSNNAVENEKPKAIYLGSTGVEDVPESDEVVKDKNGIGCVPAPGNKFYLNRLQFTGLASSEHDTDVSLPELLHPVEGLLRVFIATFTSDIQWFLSFCAIPAHLPVTIACHNAERCWSASPDKRTVVPYSYFPNLVVVYPPFPEVIAFGKDRTKLGIACHHPKLLVLQREDSIRVVITSANLVAKQWVNVSNTVWWQDFPLASAPDYLSLFTQSPGQDSQSDFAAQLAGFMASLVAEVPSQANWILELTKYDFKRALGHLVASIPGIHSHRVPCISEPAHFLTAKQHMRQSFGVKLLGSVEASVVGSSHLFQTSVDSNGTKLKKLAAFLGKCHENAYGMSEIILKRSTNIPADTNAVSVLIPNPEELPEGDCIQLGFLPRHVAKWVAPLSDIGFFAFSAYIYPKEVLATVLEGSNNKVQLILYVSQGPTFSELSAMMQPEHVSPVCSLVASIQRCSGLWRLQEVLGHYKWPEHLETDFIYGASSIGSVSAQFLAAFSAAVGKRSLQFCDSEESDPDWGCWSASQELRNPSIRIIFPTIERVKNASSGILSSKYLLCFSQKTWQRLRNVGILHDAIPYPYDRIGRPMHVKVARRRFQSKTDASSFGWVYCGSHNFSAAAWGRLISDSRRTKATEAVRSNSVLGSRLHICNYELGIVFIVPPSDRKDIPNRKNTNLDDIVLPFVVPAPKYRHTDRPATAQAMREAMAELTKQEKEKYLAATDPGEVIEEEIADEEEEVLEATDCIVEEKEDEKAYAETLWSQVDSSESC